jgi:cell division protein FtsB
MLSGFLAVPAFTSNTVPRTSKKRDLRSLSGHITVLLCCAWTTGYFAYHGRHGQHGFEARARLIERSNVLEFEIKSLEAVRAHLERDVALLSPEQPASDLVEEIARDMLGYSRPADRILRRP